MLRTIIKTTLRYRSAERRYHGGAVDRILAQIPKNITDKDVLINELDAAFSREENCYF